MSRHRSRVYGLTGASGVALLALWALPHSALADEAPSPCAGLGTVLAVLAEDHSLHLCKDGKTQTKYTVVFGWKGLGKAKPGDKKTPLGVYPLGRPRPSTGGKFHTFIPIRVPKSMGSAVGIHGPHRALRWLGPLGRMADVTNGCIAVAYDDEIIAIADFVKRERVQAIHILPPKPKAP